MKYIGVSTPAWTFGRRYSVPLEEVDQSEENEQYNSIKKYKNPGLVFRKEGPLNRTTKRKLHNSLDEINTRKRSKRKNKKKVRIAIEPKKATKRNLIIVKKKILNDHKKTEEIKNFLKASPGPGSYNLRKSLEKNIPIQFGSKYYDDENKKNFRKSGPFLNPSYKIVWKEVGGPKMKKPTKKKKKAKSVSKSRHSSVDESSKSNTRTKTDIINKKKTDTCGKFGKAKRMLGRKFSGPGPADYYSEIGFIQKRLKSGKGPSLKQKYYKKTALYETPGPGAYRTVLRRKNAGCRFGTGKRSNLGANDLSIPGPGSYETQKKNFEKYKAKTLTREKRPSSQKEWIPGPGEYSLNARKTSGPAYRIGVRRKTWVDNLLTQKNETGLGSSNPLYKAIWKNLHGTVLNRNTVKKLKLGKIYTPGPADYNNTYCSHFGKGPEVSFKMGKREKNLLNDEEIRVQYDIKHTIPQLQIWEKEKLDRKGWKIKLDESRQVQLLQNHIKNN